MEQQPRTASVGRGRAVGGLLAVVAVLASGGCYKSPFTQETGRSPFDQYDRRQSQHAEPYVWDAYGQRRPNLRERLRPKE